MIKMARPVETIDPKLEASRYITVDGEYEERESFAGMVYSDSLLHHSSGGLGSGLKMPRTPIRILPDGHFSQELTTCHFFMWVV